MALYTSIWISPDGTTSQYSFRNANLVLGSVKGTFSCDLLSNEIPLDSFSFTVRHNIDAPLLYNANSQNNAKAYRTADSGTKVYVVKKPDDYGKVYLQDIAPTSQITWSGIVGIGKGFLKSIKRIAKYQYQVTAQSGIGLLQSRIHVGGIYSGTTVGTIIESIIGNTFRYKLANDVRDTTVYGRLPYDTARNNLHRLLFAVGASVCRDGVDPYFRFLDTAMTNIPLNRITLKGSTEYLTPCDAVEVTEHSYYAQNSDEVVSLFDNSNGASVTDQTIIFDAPMHDLAVTGSLTISASSVNHAVVSGVGKLTGKKYTHNAIIIREGNSSGVNIKRVTDNELISFANSYYVAKRLYAYYTASKRVKAGILMRGSDVNNITVRCGDLVAIMDSFGEPTNAYITQMDVSTTGLQIADCTMIAGYQPDASGNNFTHKKVITSGTTWTVPNGVTRIRIVLIGGGQGGQGGYDGTDGLDRTTTPKLEAFSKGYIDDEGGYFVGNAGWGYANDNQPAGKGGNAGAAGAKASFLIADKTVTAGEVITITVGVGGAGGARNGGTGSNGTASTAQSTSIGTLSSADGVSTYEGFNDPISGNTYAIAGTAGIRGGDGGRSAPYGQADYNKGDQNGNTGASCKTWSGGSGGNGARQITDNGKHTYSAAGGGGGGAAYGADGGAGGNGSWVSGWITIHGEQWPSTTTTGGNGGNGANAVAPSQPSTYGQGGTGGNGGGGGGNAGGVNNYTAIGWQNDDRVAGTKGTGGQGSSGSQGGNGAVFIYY